MSKYGLVVLERRDQAIEDRIVKILRLQVAHHRDRIAVPAAQRRGEIALADLRCDLLHLRRPVLEAVTAQMLARVLDEQRFDVVDVATDLLVVRPTAERHQRAGDDVDEAPGELLERGRVAFARQLVRDAGRDLGDA